MKKVGILNLQHTYNYGAVLQAYALEKVIGSLGYNAQTINYCPYQGKTQYIKSLLKDVVNFGDVFESFRKTNMNRSLKVKDLEPNLLSNYDSLVVGSDQVWRPRFTKPNAIKYFFQGAGPRCNRISYAASFGVDEWETEFSSAAQTAEVIEELNKFNAISVREKSGIDICSKNFNVEAEHVLDPTLLAGKEVFSLVADQSTNKQNIDIVVYKLNIDKDFTKAVTKFAENKSYSMKNIYNISNYIDVASWVEKIRSAKIVITDSYHGVCFCIMFNKNFVCVVNKTRGKARLESLLGSLGLSHRLVENINEIVLDDLVDINYHEANEKLIKMREHSLVFLRESLAK